MVVQLEEPLMITTSNILWFPTLLQMKLETQSAKYFAVKEMTWTNLSWVSAIWTALQREYGSVNIPLVEKVSLSETLDSLSSPIESLYPKKMEELGTGYGTYSIVRKQKLGCADEERIRMIDGRDRAQLFIDG